MKLLEGNLWAVKPWYKERNIDFYT
jgi:hypothetical protein